MSTVPIMPEQIQASTMMNQDQSAKDQYCYICEDGGNLVDCSWCSNSCCYDIIGQMPEKPDDEPAACVSITESMAHGEDVLFPCPECAAERGLSSIGYFVNQGARLTMRRAPRTSLLIVVYHLNAFKALATTLAEQLNSALSSFYVPVAWQTRLIHRDFSPRDMEPLLKEIPENCPYHLAVIFLTEGDPQGGWWHTSSYGSQKEGRISEKEFLATCLLNMKEAASGALSARVFGVACGFNLKRNGSIEAITSYVEKKPFTSLLMPSTCSLLMSEYLTMFPEIFINLYYFGAPLEPTLYRVWGKSRAARTHTGFVLMDRETRGLEMNVRLILYAPVTRPLGVPLPEPHTICGCRKGDSTEWHFKRARKNPPELVFIYRSKCCQVELQVGIYADQRREIHKHEVTFVVEPWNRAKGCFTFSESKNVRMKILPPHPDHTAAAVDLSSMWTSAGRKAVKRASQMDPVAN